MAVIRKMQLVFLIISSLLVFSIKSLVAQPFNDNFSDSVDLVTNEGSITGSMSPQTLPCCPE